MFPGRVNVRSIRAVADRGLPLSPHRIHPPAPTGDLIPPGRAPNNEEGPSGFIVVRLGDMPAAADGNFNTLEELAKAANLDDLLRVMAEFDLGAGKPLVRSVPQGQLREMERKAAQSPFPPLRSLTSYWKLDVRGQIGRLDEVIKVLRSVPGVAAAYPEAQYTEPAVNPANDAYNGQQGYLDAAPDGIDARWAWTQPNGCGAGIGVVDVERG